MDVEGLIEIRDLLKESLDRWDWELGQAENTRLAGKDDHFLRAKAGHRCAQAALDRVEIMLGNATGWPGLFEGTPSPAEAPRG